MIRASLGDIGADSITRIDASQLTGFLPANITLSITGNDPDVFYVIWHLSSDVFLTAVGQRQINATAQLQEEFRFGDAGQYFISADIYYNSGIVEHVEMAGSIQVLAPVLHGYPSAYVELSPSSGVTPFEVTATLKNISLETDYRMGGGWVSWGWGDGQSDNTYGQMTMKHTYYGRGTWDGAFNVSVLVLAADHKQYTLPTVQVRSEISENLPLEAIIHPSDITVVPEGETPPSEPVAPAEIFFQLIVMRGAVNPDASISWQWDDVWETVPYDPFLSIQHFYPTPGTFIVRVQVVGMDGKAHTFSLPVTIGTRAVNLPPDETQIPTQAVITPIQAYVLADKTIGDASSPVQFALDIDSSLILPGSVIVWNWGDGTSDSVSQDGGSLSSLPVVSHTYADPGEYHIFVFILRADDGSKYSIDGGIITIQPAVKLISDDGKEVQPPVPPDDDGIVQPSLDDGSLPVEDNVLPLVAYLDSELHVGTVPFTVAIQCNVTSGSLSASAPIFYDFDDGTSSVNGTRISHTYDKAGIYFATAHTTDGSGSTIAIAGMTVTVNSAGDESIPPPAEAGFGGMTMLLLAGGALAMFASTRRSRQNGKGRKLTRKGSWR